MKEALKSLLALIIALLRTPPTEENQASLGTLRSQISQKQREIDIWHGDHEINDPQVRELFDDLATVAASATPDEEYAETPPDPESESESESELTAKQKREAKAVAKAR